MREMQWTQNNTKITLTFLCFINKVDMMIFHHIGKQVNDGGEYVQDIKG